MNNKLKTEGFKRLARVVDAEVYSAHRNYYMDKLCEEENEKQIYDGVTLGDIKQHVLEGKLDSYNAAQYVAKCLAAHYGNDEPWQCYLDPEQFVNVEHEAEMEQLARDVLGGVTVDELRCLVTKYKLKPDFAANYFARHYCAYFNTWDDYDNFYDSKAFDPAYNFGFSVNETE